MRTLSGWLFFIVNIWPLTFCWINSVDLFFSSLLISESLHHRPHFMHLSHLVNDLPKIWVRKIKSPLGVIILFTCSKGSSQIMCCFDFKCFSPCTPSWWAAFQRSLSPHLFALWGEGGFSQEKSRACAWKHWLQGWHILKSAFSLVTDCQPLSQAVILNCWIFFLFVCSCFCWEGFFFFF